MPFIRVSLILLAVFATACGKPTKSEIDPGPQFDAKSPQLTLSSKDSASAVIKRSEPTSGPRILMEDTDGSPLASVKRELKCENVTIPGRTVDAGDPTMLTFRISEEEFQGLSALPMHSPCKLVVTAKDVVGSTVKKTYPLNLNFDTPAPIEIKRHVAVVGYNPSNARGEIPLETFEITNHFPYDVGFTFAPQRQGVGYVKFKVVRNQAPDSAMISFFQVSLVPGRIDVTGDISAETGDLVQYESFVVPAGGSAKLVSYGQITPAPAISEILPCSEIVGSFIGTSTSCDRVITGFYLTQVQGVNSLVQWQSFQRSKDDEAHPAYVSFPSEDAIPGVQPGLRPF